MEEELMLGEAELVRFLGWVHNAMSTLLQGRFKLASVS